MISIHHGLGAGIILDGRVLQGRHGNIGELGHIQIDPKGKQCHCGNIGCLETLASSKALREVVAARIEKGDHTSIPRDNVTVESICEAAESGDQLAIEEIQQLGRYLGYSRLLLLSIYLIPKKC